MFPIATLFLAFVFIKNSIAGDGILFSNNDNFQLQPIQHLVGASSHNEPLILFLIKEKFRLGDFSRMAMAYSEKTGKTSLPSITSALKSSKGYAGEWIHEDISDALDQIQDDVIRYIDAADTPKITHPRAKVILVTASTIQDMDKKVGSVLEALSGKAYRAILTGLPEVTRRQKREAVRESEAATAKNATGTFINGTTCMMYTNSITLLNKPGTKNAWITINIGPKAMGSSFQCTNGTTCNSNGTCGQASFSLQYSGLWNGSLDKSSPLLKISSISLQLDITLYTTGYWKVTDILVTSLSYTYNGKNTKTGPLKGTVLTSMNLYSVATFSYACYQTDTIYLNGTSWETAQWGIQLGKFQVQPFMGNGKQFTDNVDDCVGFFTIGIWMGIVVGLLILFIFLYGIAMITSLKTMSRFEDPKGKPIQINAKE